METTLKTTSKLNTQIQSKSGDQTLLAGVITGQIAGLIMAVVVMLVFTLFLGKNPLFPVQVIGSTVFGEAALQGIHIGAILAGLAIHQLGPSILWGLLFGFLAKKFSIQSISAALKFGIGVGIFSMVGPYILIPAVMNTLHGVDFWNQQVPIFWDWAAHIVFGASFALYPAVLGKFQAKS